MGRSTSASSRTRTDQPGLRQRYPREPDRDLTRARRLRPTRGIGVGVNYVFGKITDYDVAALHAGRYSNWSLGLTPARPNGIEYVQAIDTRGLTPANLSTAYAWGSLNLAVTNNPTRHLHYRQRD